MRFTPNQPIVTDEPRVAVDPGLPVGIHRFQLVVVNDRGQRSEPAEVVVVISRRGLPIRDPF